MAGVRGGRWGNPAASAVTALCFVDQTGSIALLVTNFLPKSGNPFAVRGRKIGGLTGSSSVFWVTLSAKILNESEVNGFYASRGNAWPVFQVVPPGRNGPVCGTALGAFCAGGSDASLLSCPTHSRATILVRFRTNADSRSFFSSLQDSNAASSGRGLRRARSLQHTGTKGHENR